MRFDFFGIFRLQVFAERLPLTPIFQNMIFVHYLLRLATLTKIAKFNLPSILLTLGLSKNPRCGGGGG